MWVWGGLAAAILACAPFAAGAQATTAPPLRVIINHAQVIQLEGSAATELIADPTVADIVSERGNVIFVLGHTIGTTNLLVYDASGRPLVNREIVVVPDESNVVTVTRDVFSNDYYCTPRCVQPPPPSGFASASPPGANQSNGGGAPGGPTAPTPSAPAAPATSGAPLPAP